MKRMFTAFVMMCLLNSVQANDNLIASNLLGGKSQIPADSMGKAAEILKATGSSGGLVIHLGSGDGVLSAAIGKSGSYVVHGLDTGSGNVQKLRDYVVSLGLYGRVSSERLGDKLPYIDNLVNLIVIDNPGSINEDEMMRVLAPGGRLYYLASGKIQTKPAMEGIDDWTHFMHSSTGNAVADDTRVSPPKYLKWIGGTRWSRSHSYMGSMTSLVAAKGRVFSIVDVGFDEKSDIAPANWKLTARDAYNGILLWEVPIQKFHDHTWSKKSGPSQLPQRLVTDGDRVYVTLDINGPVQARDTVTGELIREYVGSSGTEEILSNNKVLFLLRNPQRATGNHREPVRANTKGFYYGTPYPETEKEIMAIDAQTGVLLWKEKSNIVVTTLSVDEANVYYHNGSKIICLDRKDGKKKWESIPVATAIPITPSFAPTLIVHKGVVLYIGGTRYSYLSEQTRRMRVKKGVKLAPRETTSEMKSIEEMVRSGGLSKQMYNEEPLYAFDATTGKKMWEVTIEGKLYTEAKHGIFAIGDVVWSGDVGTGGSSSTAIGVNPYTGFDLKTGKIIKQFTRQTPGVAYHQRCYPNKATVNYLMPSIRGVELVDHKNEKWSINNWIRPGCSFGLMPSHGMIYVPSHACTCFTQSKVKGFVAVYGDAMGATKITSKSDLNRLEQGTYIPLEKQKNNEQEWPTYRSNNLRTGSTKQKLSRSMNEAWTTKLGGKLSALTVAEGLVFVAQKNKHTVSALSAETGEKIWNFVASGRIDSPPTLYGGRAYFGSSDGYLYCLNSVDGSLVWRFLAAADDRRIIANGQIESVHPLHGSILIDKGIVYCLAGRSMFLDGGLRLYRLDADTGKQLSLNSMNAIDPFTGKDIQLKTIKQTMPATIPDILSTDGKHIFMGKQSFNMDGKRTSTKVYLQDVSKKSIYEMHQGEGRHIFSPQGFLDDSRFHRNKWVYGKVAFGGAQDEWDTDHGAASGHVLVCDDKNVFGYFTKYNRAARFLSNSVFCVSKQAKQAIEGRYAGWLTHTWITPAKLHVNSLLLADKLLFAAAVDESTGKAEIRVFETESGVMVNQYDLLEMSVWDGMAAAKGNLYIALKNGEVICFKK